MVVTTIDAKMLQKMFLAGAQNLDAKKEWINELNVFPVPDGDTGTNMTLTIMSAAKEVSSLEEPTLESLAKAISSGSLRGARGNSGVILSQLFRGFTKVIKDAEVIDTAVLAQASQKAVETAYKAVMKPKEGTILTVARGAADKAVEVAEQTDNIVEMMNAVINHAEDVLNQTPEMLPVLKQAGVVDSGGQGLMQVLRGAFDALIGKEIEFEIVGKSSTGANIDVQEEIDIKFGYCTEFIINIEKKYTEDDELEFKAYLESIGDSIVVVSDDDLVKVHVHTNDPGLAIQKALTYGSLSRMKIDNMREEHQEKLIKDAQKVAKEQKAKLEAEKKAMPRKDFGFIAVSIGAGMNEIFKGLGVDYLIEGGQTMNPSTEDMLNAIDHVNADHIFILPNNKNIILAAEQAMKLTKDKDIIVIPSKTVPQGITAVINFMPDATVEDNTEAMTEGMSTVKTGQVTYAVRDTQIDDKVIHMNDIMGIGDKGIQAVGSEIDATTLELVATMVDEDSELISIYYGEDVSEETANELAAAIEEAYPDVDVEVNYGGQPIYYYLLSVE
ncbi:MAG: DAK2 domain-containing protein [Lachnospiraceae bacterium]|nr:DAK2 domain-containing protein [Lachnospiraceae bacterium]